MRVGLIISVFFFIISAGIGEAALSCSVTTNCLNTVVFKMFATTNSHAEIAASTNYNYKVCCSTESVLSTACTGSNTILRLAANTNAHVQKNIFSDYPIPICLSPVVCEYTTQDCIAAGYDTCLATIYSNTNSHISDCVSSPFPTKICCRTDSSVSLISSCEQDCTLSNDNIVHASCDGFNGCTFYNNVSKAACDNSQPGWVREYNSTHYVVCPSSSPQLKIEIKASVSCESGTLVKVTRIVVYNGKPVKLVVAACG